MKLLYQICCSCVLFFVINLFNQSMCSQQADLIKRWAGLLGKDLWHLGLQITSKDTIETRYKTVNLEAKDPKQIIEEIVGNVSYMMKKKMDAVDCIINLSENLTRNFDLETTKVNYTYYRSNRPDIYRSGIDPPDPEMYQNMSTNNDTHFFNLAVNTNHSSVHVPTNVYHKHVEAETAIKWSELLDEVFIQNYKADPALSWQYFGSSSGIMRHYPAMEWGSRDKGLFDCRIRTWFIEAATCTKDVVILIDTSGSMTGMHIHIASLVVNTILDTLSNNDYVNIMNYSQSVTYLIPCFKDVIVQATEENIVVFKNNLHTLDPQNKSYTDVAVDVAFNLLYKYRHIRNCSGGNSKFCNQAVMLITDGITNNVSKVIDKYTKIYNESSSPIRIFTFLVGKEATHLTEATLIACSNRGYHSHVDALEQVTQSVYKYIMVFARPLVLHAQHPLSWTHAYYDDTFEFENPETRGIEKYRLLTSVAGPVLDQKANESNETKTAKLLGVAGTDVPIAEISKLMYPYKTGVNSHSFIVSNNGYVLKHPDLRPMFEDILKDNYNSIDLTEVEQLDDELGPRELGDSLLQLRDALVEGKEGVLHDVKIKYHYDDMRRVSREINDYYYAPINGTPFSIAFAIPDLYGNYSIEVVDEITLNIFSIYPISDFFTGTNWRIHSKWVYCKYHYLEGHEYPTPEKEFMHFIEKMKLKNFKWSQQYEDEGELKHQANCGSKTLGDEDYYCDRDLVTHVVFDAKHTKGVWTAQNNVINDLRLFYNPTLRFLATMSGLTRWEYIDLNHETNETFGDIHNRAIDETWYKSAVIQQRYNLKSFTYSVPFDSQEEEDLLVTGSSAIFPEKNGISAPVAVVGYQFSLSHLRERFFNITASSSICKNCSLCGDGLECYLIDSSGYIIVSKDKMHTGIFFGEIHGNIMESMVRKGIFEKVTIRDYQAICYFDAWVSGNSNIITTPYYYLLWAGKWILNQLLWMLINLNLNVLWEPASWLVDAADETTDKYMSTATPKSVFPKCNKKCNENEEEWHEKNKIPKYKKSYATCEKERDLYILQQQIVNEWYSERIDDIDCVRPFYLRMISNSNLLLIAVESKQDPKATTCYFVHTTAVRDIVYLNHTRFPCQKLYLNKLSRRPLQGCYNEHPLEKEIVDCGKCCQVYCNINLIIASILLFLFNNKYC